MITKPQIGWLKHAAAMAKEWRGARMPEEWPLFDRNMRAIDEAIKQVEADRKELATLQKQTKSKCR